MSLNTTYRRVVGMNIKAKKKKQVAAEPLQEPPETMLPCEPAVPQVETFEERVITPPVDAGIPSTPADIWLVSLCRYVGFRQKRNRRFLFSYAVYAMRFKRQSPELLILTHLHSMIFTGYFSHPGCRQEHQAQRNAHTRHSVNARFKGHLPGTHARLRRRRADDGQVRQGPERLLFH